MTVMSDITGKPLKHYAVNRDTGARYFMIAYENDTNKDTCSVIDMDMLSSELRAELTDAINSDECQSQLNPYKVLDRKFFYEYPKDSILQVLRKLKLIQVLDSEKVMVQLPNDVQWTPKEIMDGVRTYENKVNSTLKGKDKLLAEKDVELNETKKIESKNAEDIKDLKEDIASLKDSIKDLISIVKESKKN